MPIHSLPGGRTWKEYTRAASVSSLFLSRRKAVVLLIREIAAVVNTVLHHRVDQPAIVNALKPERIAAERVDGGLPR